MEVKNWPSHYSEQIKNFLYNHRAAESPYVLGISSVGTLHAAAAEMDIDKRLATPDATL